MSIWQADGWWQGAEPLPSPNFGERPPGTKVSLIVVHNISLPPDEFSGHYVEDFFLNRLDAAVHPYFSSIFELRVSAHFYVRRDGTVVQFVSGDQRAWHAGQSSWQGRDNCNDYSVGIELAGSDQRVFTAAQYAALWQLIDALRQRYPITGVVGHCHVAPGRKTDPGPYFDWAQLRARYRDLNLPAEVTA